MLGRVAFVELTPTVLTRALEPFPVAVRTLDALHLATIEYLRANGQRAREASHDDRMAKALHALGIDPFPGLETAWSHVDRNRRAG